MRHLDPVLTDKNQFPTEAVLEAHLGPALPLWQQLSDHLHTDYPECKTEWRYYNDGKSWLLKLTRKTKTLCWISVYQGTFRMTFYFPDKAEAAIRDCAIADALKEQFLNGRRYNRIRGLTITFLSADDLAQAKTLIPLKLSIK